jgi:hypothetical protein
MRGQLLFIAAGTTGESLSGSSAGRPARVVAERVANFNSVVTCSHSR